MKLAPILLFVYNRPWHTRKTVEALQKNELAGESELFIFSDGPKNTGTIGTVNEVREFIKTINGFKKIKIIERTKNLGLANSIIDGVTQVVNEYGKVIVLEDDIITSPFFLRYMNDALIIYREDKRIMHISGYFYPIERIHLPETFFLRTMLCWGWGTWSRAWNFFDNDINRLIGSFSRSDRKKFNFDGCNNVWKQLEYNKSGKIKTWAVFWYASIFLNNGLSLYPSESLTHNIGNDGSGVHCNPTNIYDILLTRRRIKYFSDDFNENCEAMEKIKKFHKNESFNITRAIGNKVESLIKNLLGPK